jgi:hypothetical protein
MLSPIKSLWRPASRVFGLRRSGFAPSRILVLTAIAALSLSLITVASAAPNLAAPKPTGAWTAPAPLAFEANCGQVEGAVQFIARGQDCSVLIAPTEAGLILSKRDGASSALTADRIAFIGRGVCQTRCVRFRLAGANEQARMIGLEALPGKVNYYLGNDPTDWHAGIPLFSRVQVDQVYPGIRLVYYADESARLEYDFVVQPGFPPERISWEIEGVDGVQVDGAGNLVLNVGGEQIRQHKPVIYQLIHGVRRPVEGGFRLAGARTVGFRVGSYARQWPLIIDPVVTFSDYIGGKKNDMGWGIAADNRGNVWVVGETLSANLRSNITSTALQTDYQGGHKQFGDGFVAKYANGTNLSYLTYLGGKNEDAAFAVAVDQNSGAAAVTGYTDSGNFPIYPPGVYQTQLGGTNLNGRRVYPIDAFVTKLDTNGVLVYSTYLGGNSRDVGLGIAVDNLGRAYVTGLTESSNFPTVNALQGPYLREGVNYDGTVNHRNQDAFVARLNASATALDYYSYLGGSNQDIGQGIAVDSAYSAYVVGSTASTNFPIINVFQPQANYLNNQTNRASYTDGFISRLSADGQALLYSSYLGGSNSDAALAIAVDAATNAYVTGYTYSTNFPVTLNEFTRWTSKSNYNADVFVVKFDPGGQTNGGYAVVFGGRYDDQGIGIAVDTNQNAYIVGSTLSKTNFAGTETLLMTNFFAANPASGFSQTNSTLKKYGKQDAFLVVLAPNGTNQFSAYLGGSGNDQANGIALDLASGPNPIAYLAGTTWSTNFPGTATNTFHGNKKYSDAFMSRIQFP